MKTAKSYIQEILKSYMPPEHILEKLKKYKWDMADEYITPNSSAYHLLEKRKHENIRSFCDSYKKIKSDRTHWPDCNSLSDWYELPDSIRNECVNIHKFSPSHYINDSGDENFFDPNLKSLYISEINDQYNNDFPETSSEILKIIQNKQNIVDNIELIKNSKIVEFAAGDGLTSAIAIYLGALSAKVTDIADINLKHCKKTKELFGYDDNFRILKSDISNIEKTKNHCKNTDIVLLQNILSIIDNKREVLAAIASVHPKYIIISDGLIQHEPHNNGCKLTATDEKDNYYFINSSLPLVKHYTTSCYIMQSPYWSRHRLENFENIKKEPVITLKFPNIAWYDSVLNNLGYSRIKYQEWSANPFYIKYKNAFSAVYEFKSN